MVHTTAYRHTTLKNVFTHSDIPITGGCTQRPTHSPLQVLLDTVAEASSFSLLPSSAVGPLSHIESNNQESLNIERIISYVINRHYMSVSPCDKVLLYMLTVAQKFPHQIRKSKLHCRGHIPVLS